MINTSPFWQLILSTLSLAQNPLTLRKN